MTEAASPCAIRRGGGSRAKRGPLSVRRQEGRRADRVGADWVADSGQARPLLSARAMLRSCLTLGVVCLMGDTIHPPAGWQRAIQALMATRLPGWILPRVAHRLDWAVLRLSKGRVTATQMLTGLPVVLLSTIGAKTGKSRRVPLVGIRLGDQWVLIASAFGAAHHPAWYHNLRVHPDVTLEAGDSVRTYSTREVEGEERDACWRVAVGLFAGYQAYQRRAGARRIPVLVLTPKRG